MINICCGGIFILNFIVNIEEIGYGFFIIVVFISIYGFFIFFFEIFNFVGDLFMRKEIGVVWEVFLYGYFFCYIVE